MASIGESAFIFNTVAGLINDLTKEYQITRAELENGNKDLKSMDYLQRSLLVIEIRTFWDEYYKLKKKKIKYEQDPEIEKKVEAFIEIVEPIFADLKSRWPYLREVRNMFYAHGYRNDSDEFQDNDVALRMLAKSILTQDDFVYIANNFITIAELCKAIFRNEFLEIHSALNEKDEKLQSLIPKIRLNVNQSLRKMLDELDKRLHHDTSIPEGSKSKFRSAVFDDLLSRYYK